MRAVGGEALAVLSFRERLRRGYRSARRVTRAHAKSFYFASFALFGRRRDAAFALYAFCRRLDDLVDASSGEAQGATLQRVRGLLPRLFAREEDAEGVDSLDWGQPFVSDELHALRDTLRRFEIPEQPFHDLLSGMEMDLRGEVYRSFEQLDLYCYRVAGTVGLLLAPVLGYRDPAAIPAAADLGRAMQLTNILRDVGDDLALGRIYLPRDELARSGLSEADLVRGVTDVRWRGLARLQIDRARALYARAEIGIPLLAGYGSRLTVRLMRSIYGDILRVIEARGYDVFAQRARVSLGRKLWLALGAILRPRRALPPPAEVAAERRAA